MKTGIDWFIMLPDPHGKQAIDATNIEALNFTFESLPECLLSAFNWSSSPQGHYYWHDFYLEIIANEILLNLQNTNRYEI